MINRIRPGISKFHRKALSNIKVGEAVNFPLLICKHIDFFAIHLKIYVEDPNHEH